MLACEVCVYVSVIMCIYSVISIQFDYNNNLDIIGTILNVVYMYI